MEAFVVGDRVVVRTVDEMIESGLFYGGNAYGYGDIILTPTGLDYAFNKHMQYLCGQTGIITQIINRYRTEIKIKFDDPSITLERDDGSTWHISPGMIKYEETVMSDEDLAYFLNEF